MCRAITRYTDDMKVRSKIQRFGISFLVGILVGAIVFFLTKQWQLIPLAAWDGLVLVLLGLYAHDFHGHTPKETERISRHDNLGQSITDIILLVASLASLGAVILLLSAAQSSPLDIAFCLLSIVLSWATVHSVYTLRYAVMYYDNKADGIDFSSMEQPTFVDFAYVAFTIGMTYQVSDTTFTSTRFRRVALRHALLSFVFGMAIIAISINFIAGLAK